MIPVTTRALVQRINRAFEREDGRDPHLEGPWRVLKSVRGLRAREEFGDYYVLDARINVVMEDFVDVEELGREIDALKPYEQLVEEEE